MKIWPVQDAKARFSEMLETCLREGPQLVTRRGTDAAVLGDAGIPSVLFGPTGAGLHSLEEWVDVQSVLTCRDTLINLARQWCV